MEIVGVLLRHGAKWTISDSMDLLPDHYIDVSNGDGKMVEFKRLCEEETSQELKKRKEEDELRQAKEREAELERAAEEEESKRLKKLEEERKRLKKLAKEEESKRLKKLEEESNRAKEEELKRLKKLEDQEALLKRRTRQRKCFPSPITNRAHVFLSFLTSQKRSRESLETKSSGRGVRFGLSRLPSVCARMAGSILTVPLSCSSLAALA
jgi:hypothetical protein